MPIKRKEKEKRPKRNKCLILFGLRKIIKIMGNKIGKALTLVAKARPVKILLKTRYLRQYKNKKEEQNREINK